MSIIKNFYQFVNKPVIVSIFAGIAADPSASQSWKDLYNNIFFRFMFISVILYQNNPNLKETLIFTVLTMGFFYLTSNKEEKKEVFRDNYRKKDLETFGIFILFIYIVYHTGIQNI